MNSYVVTFSYFESMYSFESIGWKRALIAKRHSNIYPIHRQSWLLPTSDIDSTVPILILLGGRHWRCMTRNLSTYQFLGKQKDRALNSEELGAVPGRRLLSARQLTVSKQQILECPSDVPWAKTAYVVAFRAQFRGDLIPGTPGIKGANYGNLLHVLRSLVFYDFWDSQ